MAISVSRFGLAYLGPEEIEAWLHARDGHVLGVIGFGSKSALPELPCDPLWVDIPVLGGPASSFEVWTSDSPTLRCVRDGICGAADGEVLFASLTLEQGRGDTLETLAEHAYKRIFDYVDHFDYGHLLRVWHYFPQINDDENGLERYRSFNVGRHAAFVASGRNIGEEDVPAASALGSNSGSLTIYFMAGKQAGRAVENPRQVSAYQYPDKFGPKSPIFVRALSARLGGRECFFISGTASIVGYETLHQGDSEKQSVETLLNIRTLLGEFPHYDPARGDMLLKVYLRDPADLDMVRKGVEAEFGADCKAVYLHSNICRSDLLLEIEGAYFNEAH